MAIVIALWCVAILLAVACLAVALRAAGARARRSSMGHASPCRLRDSARARGAVGRRTGADTDAAARPALDRRAFPARRALGLLPRRGQSRRRRRQPVRARLRPPRGGSRADPAVLSGLPRRHEPRRARRRRVHVPGRVGVHVALVLRAGDGAPSRSGERPRRIHLSRDGEHRHARAAARLRRARRRATAAIPSRRSARPRPRRRSRRSRSASRCSAPARRPGSCRCMSGCRSPIRPRRATSRR